MPMLLIKKYQREYERKGETPKAARIIAFKIANKQGLLHNKNFDPKAARKADERA